MRLWTEREARTQSQVYGEPIASRNCLTASIGMAGHNGDARNSVG